MSDPDNQPLEMKLISSIQKLPNRLKRRYFSKQIPDLNNPPRKIIGGFQSYLLAIIITGLTTLLAYWVELSISPTNLVMLYILAVMVAAVYLGRGPSILVSFLGVLLFDFLFVPPYFTFAVDDTEYVITFAGLLLVGLVISALAVTAQQQTEEARSREADTLLLYSLSQDLSNALNDQDLATAIFSHFPKAFGDQIVLYLPHNGELVPFSNMPNYVNPESEMVLAKWSYKFRQPSGLGTTVLPSLEPRFLPLISTDKIFGVISLLPRDPTKPLPHDQKRLLDAFLNQISQAREKMLLVEQARKIEMLQTTEKLQNALLNSISHELRTPLATITGTLTTLENQGSLFNTDVSLSLISTAREEADRLNRLVGNLLDMTRLEAGALNIKRDSADIMDLIGTALTAVSGNLGARKVSVNVDDNLTARLDFVLIVHVLTNLLDNAIKYSPLNSAIEISASSNPTHFWIKIRDYGSGIAKLSREKIFEKFFRENPNNHLPGTGLGLAICKGIIEAHNGQIWVEDGSKTGSVFTIQLPL